MSVQSANWYPLSAVQKAIWFGQEINSQSPAYNMAQYCEIHGELDIELLRLSVYEAIRATQATRISFELIDGMPMQTEASSYLETLDFQYINLSDDKDPIVSAHALMKEARLIPFDLKSGQLTRWRFICIGHNHHLWFQCGHHITLDGHAGAILSQRVADIYTSLSECKEPPRWPRQYFEVLMNLSH